MNELLDRFDRMLLTTDGTVTTLLEACTGEPIATRDTAVGAGHARGAPHGAGCWWHPGADLLDVESSERCSSDVTLSGATSGIPYVMAEALVALDRLAARRSRCCGRRIARAPACTKPVGDPS